MVEFGDHRRSPFEEAGLEVEVFHADGGAQTVATVASGSVDIAMSNGILGAIGAYVKGGDATPLPHHRGLEKLSGAHELFWWVKADSPIKSLKDARRQDHRILVAWLVVEPLILLRCSSRPVPRAKPTRDRRRARNLHADHDRPD